MMILVAAVAGMILAVTLAAQVYLRRASRSTDTALEVWGELVKAAEKAISDPNLPEPVARLSYGMAQVAGCGCFVRGVMLAHYLPNRRRRASEEIVAEKAEFEDAVSHLSKAQKASLNTLIVLVIAFDSFSNPLQGWLFRRLLSRLAYAAEKKQLPKEYLRECNTAALRVVHNKTHALA